MKKILSTLSLVLLAASMAAAAPLQKTSVNSSAGYLANETGLAYSTSYPLDVALYDALKRTNLICNFLNGAIATFISGIATYPFDYVKRVWQIRDINNVANKKRLPSFVCSVLAKEGVKGLYKGLMACCCKVVPANALLFYFNEKLKALL